MIGAEHSVPDRGSNAEIVIPHAFGVVQMMNRAAQPKTAFGVFVLQLVSVSRKGGVEQGATRKANPRLERVQKPCGKERPRASRVSEKFTQKPVGDGIFVMLSVLRTLNQRCIIRCPQYSAREPTTNARSAALSQTGTSEVSHHNRTHASG